MLNSPVLSLCDILGIEYITDVCKARAALGVIDYTEAMRIANEKVDFYPQDIQSKNDNLLHMVGKSLIKSFDNDHMGAPTNAFGKAAKHSAAPMTGIANFRVGEDGRLYLIGKSEHYHASLGHTFGGFKLVDNARAIGILNATHNNTRGYITRLAEEKIVAEINDIYSEEDLKAVITSADDKILNRVINLETGSLAVEAGIKMMLMRFYKLDKTFDAPKYSAKTPVFFIFADNKGEKEANYHGTTVIAQTFRGMWPEFYSAAEYNGLYKVVAVKPNDIADFTSKIKEYNQGNYKTAGFLHELVLMNYGGICTDNEYMSRCYELCAEYDTPTLVDEIQTCMWYKGMFLFKLYGLKPDFVVIGKGFPGGEYPASKIITNSAMDRLNQFGALVTNGQEELASLSYIITMTYAKANEKNINEMGDFFESAFKELACEFPDKVSSAEGKGLLQALHFTSVPAAAAFAGRINSMCIDTSAQVYKANCPPAVLFKPPIISTQKTLKYIIDKLREALS